MQMTGFAKHQSYSTRAARLPYGARKRALAKKYTEYPCSPAVRLSSAVIECYFYQHMTLQDTAEILHVSIAEAEFAIECLIQDSQ